MGFIVVVVEVLNYQVLGWREIMKSGLVRPMAIGHLIV
jgi:hypothetical protein